MNRSFFFPATALPPTALPSQTAPAWAFARLDRDAPKEELDGLARLVRLWQSKRRDGALPGWDDFDNADFRSWDGWLALMEVGGAGGQPQVRLFGERFVDHFKRDATGGSIGGALFGGEAEPALTRLAEIAGEGGIALCDGTLDWDGRCYRRVRGCGLPLSSDGERVDMVLVGLLDVAPPGTGFSIVDVPSGAVA